MKQAASFSGAGLIATNCFVSIQDVDLGDPSAAVAGLGGEGGAGPELVEVTSNQGGMGGATVVISVDPTLMTGDGDGDGDADPGPMINNLISNSTFQMGTTPWTEGWDDGTVEKGAPAITQDGDDPSFIVACVRDNPDTMASERYLGWHGGDGTTLEPGDYRLTARVLTGDGLPEFTVAVSGIDEPFEGVFSSVRSSPGTADQVREYNFTVSDTKSRMGVVFVAKGRTGGYLCADDVQLFNLADLEP